MTPPRRLGVTFELEGFEDSNAFARAFQAWTGSTPRKVRAQMENPSKPLTYISDE
jgi:transcriptional regulator GlxA family with amidase domain